MILSIKLKELLGVACNATPSDLDQSNVGLNLSLSKNGSPFVNLINTTDLFSLSNTTVNSTYNFGNYDIKFEQFLIGNISSELVIIIQVYKAGTSVPVSWESFDLKINVTKFLYIPYENTFTFYNYDVGNSDDHNYFTNFPFEIILLPYSALNINGTTQLQPFSSFNSLPKPFTKEFTCYYMASILDAESSYTLLPSNVTTIGKNIKLCVDTNQIVRHTVKCISNNAICSTTQTLIKKNYLPVFDVFLTCNNDCNTNCINNLDIPTVTYTKDYSQLTSFNFNNVPNYPVNFMDNTTTIEILDFASNVIDEDINIILALSVAEEDYIYNYTFTPSSFGDNIVKVTNCYNTLIETPETLLNLICCTENIPFKVCNFWQIENTKDCNVFKLNNCSSSEISVNLQSLQNNVLTNLSTIPLLPFSTTDLTFSEDGIYVINVTKDGITKSYTLPVFCNFQQCWLNYLNKYLCKENCNDCKDKCDTEFQSFMINAHTYMLLLNEEMNFNYIYDAITEEKIKELSDLQMFINRLKEYCNPTTSLCIPCNS